MPRPRRRLRHLTVPDCPGPGCPSIAIWLSLMQDNLVRDTRGLTDDGRRICEAVEQAAAKGDDRVTLSVSSRGVLKGGGSRERARHAEARAIRDYVLTACPFGGIEIFALGSGQRPINNNGIDDDRIGETGIPGSVFDRNGTVIVDVIADPAFNDWVQDAIDNLDMSQTPPHRRQDG